MRPLIVGIAGGTASGKTTIAHHYSTQVGAALVGHDRYYRNAPDPRQFNFDHPDALETSLMVEHLQALRQGKPAELPVYQFGKHLRADHTETLQPSTILVVEGILVLSDPALRSCFDLSVWVECPADIRLVRRLRRDIAERGRTVDSVLQQYLATVRPMHEAYVQPSAAFAQLHLDGTQPTEQSVATLAAACTGLLRAGVY